MRRSPPARASSTDSPVPISSAIQIDGAMPPSGSSARFTPGDGRGDQAGHQHPEDQPLDARPDRVVAQQPPQHGAEREQAEGRHEDVESGGHAGGAEARWGA